MKITCNRNVILSAVKTLHPISTTKSPREVYRYVHLSASSGNVTIAASRHDVLGRYTFPCDGIESSGTMCVPSQSLLDILSTSRGEDVVIDGNRVKIGSGVFHVATMNPDEFPLPQNVNGDTEIRVSSGDLLRILKRVMHAVGESSHHSYNMDMILLHRKGNDLCAAATDGRRLAVDSARFHESSRVEGDWSQPILKSSAQLLASIMKSFAGDAILTAGETAMLVKCGMMEVYILLHAAEFPPYSSILMNDGVQVSVVCGDLIEGIRQAIAVSNRETRWIDFTIENDAINLSSSDEDGNSASITVPAECESTDKLCVRLNGTYVNDALSNLDREVKTSLLFRDDRVQISDGNGYTAVISPMVR